jgi:Tol biopolymer transport system component
MIVFQRAEETVDRRYSLWSVSVSLETHGDVRAGSGRKIVSMPKAGAVGPACSPDGEWIAFSAIEIGAGGICDSRSADLWCVRIDGTDLTRLTRSPGFECDPWWAGSAAEGAPCGRLFFSSDRGGRSRVRSLMPKVGARRKAP